jgi:hypothetical protein
VRPGLRQQIVLFKKYNAKGVILFFDINTASGTGGLQVFIKGIDPVTGKAILLNMAPST